MVPTIPWLIALLAEKHRMVEDRVAALVRDAALLLSSERDLADVFDEAHALLSRYVDAEALRVTIAAEDGPHTYLYGTALAPVHALTVPILFGGNAIGTLEASSTRRPYDDRDAELLEACALFLGAKIVEHERRALTQRLEHLASVDQLTGVANRRAFDYALEREWSRAARNGDELSVVIIDVDFFKTYNDTYGHVVGDAALTQVGRACADTIARPADLFARYGGEEFIALLPSTAMEGAVAMAEAMRAAVARLAVPHEGSSAGRLTISAGVATMRPQPGDDRALLVGAADRALYEAKSRGRDAVCAQGYASDGPGAVRAREARGNLPTPRTSFVARDDELRRIAQLVRTRACTTIAGPGGAGKTRIAIEAGRTLLDTFPDGIWYVELSSVGDAAGILSAIAASLRGATGVAPSLSQLAAILARWRALVILDNCEHIVDDVARTVEGLLDLAPDARLLCTSREALGIDGEAVHRLAPLPIDGAVALLSERATDAGAVLSGDERLVLEEIARQLDGMPLAIELAASRLVSMSARELVARLGDRLEILRASNRRGPSRQQTLRALMEWSYRLLNPEDQRLFRHLAIFSGGWTLEAALGVCDEDERSSAGTGIESLVAKSLVHNVMNPGETRFDMLETTREYAADLLFASEDAHEIAERHALYFAKLSERMRERRGFERTDPWLRTITADQRNYRAAVLWFVRSNRFAEAARMLENLIDWFFHRGHGIDWTVPLREVLSTKELARGERVAFELAVSNLVRRSDIASTIELAADAYHYYEAQGDLRLTGCALRMTGAAQMVRDGKLDLRMAGEYATIARRCEEAGDLTLASELLNNLGMLYTQSLNDEQLKDALACFDRGIELLERRGDYERSGLLNGNSSDILFYMGDAHAAVLRSRRAIALLEHEDEAWHAGLQYLNLGNFSIWDGDFTTARVALKKAFEGLSARSDDFGAASVFDKFAQLARHTGDHRRAARLLAYADRSFSRAGAQRQQRESRYVEAMRADLAQRLGERYALEYERGTAFSATEAESEALAS